jgi:hypothetical protein
MGILPSSSLRTIPAPEAVQCLRRRPEARRLAQADADSPIREHVIDAYVEARRRERDGSERDGPEPERWRLAALAVAKMTGKRVGLDTATRIGVGAQPEIGGRRWPSRRFQASLRETGMPRAVMRLSTLQPTLASTICAGGVRARSVRPMMVL